MVYVLILGYKAKLEELVVINHDNAQAKEPFCNMFKTAFND